MQRCYREPTLTQCDFVRDLMCHLPPKRPFEDWNMRFMQRGPFHVKWKHIYTSDSPPVTIVELIWLGTKAVAGHVFLRFQEMRMEGLWCFTDLFPAQDLLVLGSDEAVRFLSLTTGRPHAMAPAGSRGDIPIPAKSWLLDIYGDWFLLAAQPGPAAVIQLYHWRSRKCYRVRSLPVCR